MDVSPPFIAVAVVVAFYGGHLLRQRLKKERREARAARFREAVRAPGRPAGLQQEARPFRTDLWLWMHYPPGAIRDTGEPEGDWRVHVNV